MFRKITIFLLRPFAKPIRHITLKIMKRFRLPNDNRPAIAASDHILNEIVLPYVFQIFKEDEFRELASFKKLPVSEHDRIFNELEVGGLCLSIAYLRAIKSLVRPDDYHFWQDTEQYLPKQLQKTLMSYGVDGSHAKLLKQLVDMRYAEYEELAKKVWDANDGRNSEFKTLQPEMRQVAAMLQATAIGTTDHIRRGKIEERDPLIKYLTSWLLLLQRNIGKFIKNL